MDAELHRVHADMDESHWWFRGRRRIIQAVLERHVRSIEGGVLDIGCGSGGLLAMLGTFGPVVAVEQDPEAAARAAQRNTRADVRAGVLQEFVDELPPFGLVTAFDVIEHVADDVGLLRAMRSRVAEGGAVCVTVPAFSFLWSNHDVRNGHLRRYTAQSLQSTMEAAGLEIEHLSYLNTVLFPVVALTRFAERLGFGSADDDFSRSAGAGARVLEAVFSAERHVVKRWRVPVGVSLVVVARRR